MSKFDSTWTEERHKEAIKDGWLLAHTLDEGKPHVYYMPYPHGPRFPGPSACMKHITAQASLGSKPHIFALQVIVHSRTPRQKEKRK